MAHLTRKGLLIAIAACALATPCSAQDQSGEKAGMDQSDNQAAPNDIIGSRVQRQHLRVNHALKAGLINNDQAKKLRGSIDSIASDVADMRKKNGGALKPEEFKQIENSLNQSSEQIKSIAEAGDASVQSGKVLGPTWTKGPDGAQNPNKLLNQMKEENKRELRQEKQSNTQKLEQQQLQYEREMVENLGEQKQDVIKQKDQIKDVRKESGAD